MDLGQKILYQRKAHHLTQEQLAEKLHVTRQTLSKWEGNLSSPSLESIAEMSKLFDVPTDYFLKDEEPAKPAQENPPAEGNSAPKSALPHVFGVLSIVLGALGSVVGLIFGIIGKKKATDPKDKKLNSIGIGVSIAGLCVAVTLSSVLGYFFFRDVKEQLANQSSDSSSSLTYPVTFYDYDHSTILYESTVKRGENAIYGGKTPTREADASGSYVFSGWSPNPETTPIYQKTAFIAQYHETLNTFTVTFANYDGKTLQQDTIAYGEYDYYKGQDPAKTSDVSGTFRFDGFLPNPGQTPITKDTTFVAQFSHVLYTYKVEFRNKVEDGGDLWASGYVNYGEVPSFYVQEPFKASSVQYDYTFKSWDKDPKTTKIYSSTTFYASFNESVRSYTASFYNDDRASLLQSMSVPYGSYATYTGATPNKTADGSIYTFDHWDKDPASTPIAGDTDFYAVYTSSPNEGAFLFTELTDGTYSIKSATENFSFNDVAMPSTHLGKDVTEIASCGFSKCRFKSLTLPTNLRAVGDYAFDQATLSSVNLPASVVSLGKEAFSSISDLSEFTMSGALQSIGESCFSADHSLKSFAFPTTLTTIGAGAFNGTGLTSASLENTALSQLGDSVFQNTPLTSLSLPSTLSVVPSFCCDGCTSLTSVTLPNSITTIGMRAFKDCTSLLPFALPSGLVTLSSGAFMNTVFSSLTLPSHTNVWGSGIAEGMTSLSKVSFQEGITTLEYKILASDLATLTALKTVYVPSTVTSAVENTFYSSSESDLVICLKQQSVPTSFVSGWATNVKVALYRENKPSESGRYFHLNNAGEVELWS